MHTVRMQFLAIIGVVAGVGCFVPSGLVLSSGEDDPDHGDPTSTAACSSHADCNDGVFCNGVEQCVDGRCAEGDVPCAADEICTEDTALCTAAFTCADDLDCDDGLFCTGAETCVDGTCVAGSAPCVDDDPCSCGQICDEEVSLCRDTQCDTFEVALTAQVDQLSGTDCDDTIIGSDVTINTGDVIDGGAGEDVFEAIMTRSNHALVGLVEVETLAIRALYPTVFSVAGADDVTCVKYDRGTDDLTLTDLQDAVEVTVVTGAGDGLFLLSFADPVVSGDNDAVRVVGEDADLATLVLQNGGGTHGFETLTFVASSGLSVVDTLVSPGLSTLIIEADGDAILGLTNPLVARRFDTSRAGGAIHLYVEASQDCAVLGGAEAETFDLAGGSPIAPTEISIHGAGAADTIRLSDLRDVVERIRYEDTSDGGSALTAFLGDGDTVSNFEVGEDQIVIGGALRALLANEQFSDRTDGVSLKMDLSAAGVFLFTASEYGIKSRAKAGQLTSVTDVVLSVTGEMVGSGAILIIQDGRENVFAVYAYQCVGVDRIITNDEIQLLAFVTQTTVGAITIDDVALD